MDVQMSLVMVVEAHLHLSLVVELVVVKYRDVTNGLTNTDGGGGGWT